MPSILQGRNRPPASAGAAADEHTPQHDVNTGETRSTLISPRNGEGTHHIEHEDGTQTEHSHIGHALMHLAGKHSEGMHHHTHSDGMGGGYTAHTAEHGGEPEGPHDHENLESVKNGMDQFFNEEENEGGGGYDEGGKAEGKRGGSDGKDWE